jgi:hypothetical protein
MKKKRLGGSPITSGKLTSRTTIKASAGTVTADSRYSFTGSFLHAAGVFARRAHEMESIEDISAEGIVEHRGCVVAAVMQSVAALEAEIYEITVHGPGHHLGSNHIDLDAKSFLGPLEELIDNRDVLSRYELVLHLLKKQPLRRDTQLWERTVLLVRLRNALVHYKSRWGRDMDAKLTASLKKLALRRPSFVPELEPFFPHQCLGAHCAAWAVDTSFKFLSTFYSLLGPVAPVACLESSLAALLTPSLAKKGK